MCITFDLWFQQYVTNFTLRIALYIVKKKARNRLGFLDEFSNLNLFYSFCDEEFVLHFLYLLYGNKKALSPFYHKKYF